MKRFTTILMLALLLVSSARAQNSYHEVQVVDERGEKVTDISSVEIYLPDTTTNAVIYSDRGNQNTITIPMTTGSTNTTLSSGFFSWFGADGYDFSITDGTNIATNSGHRTRTSSEGTLVFPSYLTSITTSQYLDAESITMGTSADWVLNAGAVADLLTWTPASDGAIFRIGANDAATNGDFRVMVGTDIGLLIDEGVPSFTWTGGAASINASSNFNTTINTGSSTGTVTLGSSTAGALTLDTTSTYTLSSDGAHSTTTTDGSADITVDATAGSVIVDGGEAVDDAVIIRSTGAAGGIDITSLGDIDITTTGTAGEDITITNTGGSIIVTATENIQNSMHIEVNGGTSESVNIYSNQGTGVSATTEHDASVQLQSDDGGISLYTTANLANAIRIETNSGSSETIVINNVQGTDDASLELSSKLGGITMNAAAGSIDIEAVGASDGDLALTVGDDLVIDVTGDATVKGWWLEDSRITRTITTNFTLIDVNDIGRLILCATDNVVLTLPAVATGHRYTFVNIGADGAALIELDTNASDKILGGCGFSVLDNGDKVSNTKGTADKGDYITVEYGTADGWYITELVGTWADGG